MRAVAVRALLLILLFLLTFSRCSVIRRRDDSRVGMVNAGSSSKLNNVHNATVYCEDTRALYRTGWRCQRDIVILARYGFPWSPQGRHSPNVSDRNNTLRDALDSLNEVCHISDRGMRCLEENAIRGFCLTLTGRFTPLLVFQFICHHQSKDENLIHSLQCLHDTRVFVMLYFHIAHRCRGFGILDDIMRRYKNAYFYRLDINPFKYTGTGYISQLYCLPKPVISTCIHDIVEYHCGLMAADFVQDYILYIQDSYGQALESCGLDSNICDRDTRSDMVPSRSPVPSGYSRLSFSRLVEKMAPGTALDTVYGKALVADVYNNSGIQMCTAFHAYIAYEVCVMSSDDMSEKNKFNILQFAHHLFPTPFRYHGTQCSRLEEFSACWNLLQKICGPKVLGIEQHAALLVEGCKIQTEMETVGCHWQDMLLKGYIQASRVTVWPTTSHCLLNPLLLEDAHYGTFNGVMDNMDTVISLLQPGVDEISRKCGPQPAERIRKLLKKISHVQRDADKYMNSVFKSVYPDD